MTQTHRIGVLGSPTGWYVRDLQRAAQEYNQSHPERVLSIEPLAFDSLSVWSTHKLSVTASRSDSTSTGTAERHDLASFHSLLVRTMPLGSLEQVIFRMNALHVAQQAGVNVVNSPRCLEICIDKWLTIDRVRAAGILTPRTVCCQSRDEALEAWHQLGEDCVVKPIFGGEGRGLMRVVEYEMAWRVFSTLEQLQAVIYVQEFLPNDGSDLRLLVLNDSLYTVRRHGLGNWRANVSQGGRAEPTEPTFEQADIAYRAAKLVGGWMVGVDILETDDGRNVLLEVNAVPGWKATGAACGVDIARTLLEALTKDSTK
jgi:tetrahydromethanopterin:alpha-L-glutamate ligase